MAKTGRKTPAAGGGLSGRGRLVLRIFLVGAAAALLVATAAVLLVTLLEAPRERRRADETVDRARAAVAAARRERFSRLEATARALAAEPALVAALRSGDGESGAALTDLLAQRREDFGFDVALVVDRRGLSLAADGTAGDRDLADDPLERATREEGAARGAWLVDGMLTDAAAVRVAPDFEPLGSVLVAARSEELFALELARVSGAGVTILAFGEGRATPVGSSLAAAGADELAAELGPGAPPAGDGPPPAIDVSVGGRRLTGVAIPLAGPAGEPAGAVVLTAAVEGAGWTLVAVGVATALALLLSAVAGSLVARRTLAPVDRLAGLVEAAPREGFARRLEPARAGAVAPVAAALDRLFGRLQEERSLATAAAAADARSLAAGQTVTVGAAEVHAVVVAVDLRGFARVEPGEAAALDAGARLARDRARVRAEVEARGGACLGAAGHRMLAVFAGDEAAVAAVGAAAAAVAGAVGDAGEPPAAAVAAGRVVISPGGPHGSGVLVGPAVQLVESLLRESAAGDVVLGPSIARDVGDRLAAAGIEPSVQRGILSPRSLRLLGGDAVGATAAALPAAQPASGPDLPLAAPGTILDGRFEVVESVAVHSGSDLLRAHDRSLGRHVALRRVAAGVAAWGAAEAAGPGGALERMRGISHHGLAEVFAAGETEGGWFLSREWVDGRPLSRIGELPLPAALGLARGLAEALAAVHAEGLAHGRVVPESVLLDPAGRVRLTDLGLARLLASPPTPAGGAYALPPELRLHEGGSSSGVTEEDPRREAPVADPRSDVWGVGAILYRLVLGKWPVGGKRDAEAALAGRGLATGLERVIARCLASEPGRRFADAAELAAALEDVRA